MHVLRIVVILAVVAATSRCAPSPTTGFSDGCGNRSVAILVDPGLLAPNRAGLDRFEADLCTAGYNTVEHADGFADPAALRNYAGAGLLWRARRD